MKGNKLNKLRRAVEAMRRSQPKVKELRSVARQLGMEKEEGGRHPTFASNVFPHLRPLSIPDHKGREMAPGTKHSILNAFEDHINAWDERLSKQERANGSGHKNGSG